MENEYFDRLLDEDTRPLTNGEKLVLREYLQSKQEGFDALTITSIKEGTIRMPTKPNYEAVTAKIQELRQMLQATNIDYVVMETTVTDLIQKLMPEVTNVQELLELVLHLTNLGDVLAAVAYIAGLREGMVERET